MKYIRTLVAAAAVVAATAFLAAAPASARRIDPDAGYHEPVVVVHDPGPAVDDTVAEASQTAAGAIGGAGITLAAVWAYRRRHPVVAH